MPSLIQGFEYDIFISYRQKDNKGDKWVTAFVDALKRELEATLKDDVSIYFDENSHDGLLETHHVDKSLENKLRCLIFIPIVSQTYCDKKSFAWQLEFCAFNTLATADSFGRDIKLSNGNVASRILPVKIHGLDHGDQKSLETEIGSVLRAVEFIYREPGVNRPLNPDDDPAENLNKTRYRNQVNKVANAIKDIMVGLQNFGKPDFIQLIPEKSTEEVKPQGKSIVVLPFEDMSPEKNQEYFCDGLAEELINALTKIKDLHVVARTSAFSFKGKEHNAQKIGRKLHVESLLEGSVRKSGDKLRISVQLISVADGFPIWSEQYDRELADVFSIQGDISMQIINVLKVKLGIGEKEKVVKRYTDNFEAYDLYARGRFFRNKITEDGVRKGIRYFQQSIDKDPAYAIAYVGIADCNQILGWYYYDPSKEAYSKAKKAALKALEIDGNLSEARALLGMVKMVYDGDWDGAREEFERAIELNPNDPNACLCYAIYLTTTARHTDAIAEAKRAQRLDPVTPFTTINLAMRLYYARQYDLAIEQIQRCLEMDPNLAAAYYYLAWPCIQKGLYSDALRNINKAIEGQGKPTIFLSCLGIVYSFFGKQSEADQVLEELISVSAQKVISSYFVAEVHARLDRTDQAFEWLKKAYKERDPMLIWLKVDPLLDGLRADPRFALLLKDAGLSAEAQMPLSQGYVTDKHDKSIIVLPFENMSPDKDNEYFSDGLTEEIIADLSNVKELLVISRSSAMTLKGSQKKIKDIAGEVNVRYVLEGSVRKSGNNLRITAQLIDSRDDSHIWADKFNGTLDDVFDLQENLSRKIVNALRLKLTPDEDRRLAERPISNVLAFESYLQARHQAYIFSEESLDRALKLCQEALTHAGENELLYSMMGQIYLLYLLWGIKLDEIYLQKAEECSRKVRAINPGSSHDHALRGMISYKQGDRHDAAKELKLAIGIAPDNSSALIWLVSIYARSGSAKAMRPLLKRLLEIDPLTPFVQAWVGWLALLEGKTGPAVLGPHLKMFEMDPMSPYGRLLYGWMLAMNGKPLDMYPLVDLLDRDNPGQGFTRIGLFLRAALQGNKSVAKQHVTESLERWAKTDDMASWWMADGFALLGENKIALAWLENGVRQGLMNYPGLAKLDPLLENIRNEPQFADLLNRVKSQWEAFE